MPNIVAKIEIVMDDAGNVGVTGPIDNQLLAYGLLTVAMDVVRNHVAQASRKIQPAPLSLVGKLGKPS
ncbi:MAG TPA: hypothetical protein VMZ92_13320 [Planctomycetota bacterium]|nr:hypothetical protein [Planctomycetota bacterium]